MTLLSHLVTGLLGLLGFFFLFIPYFLWQRKKGKAWPEILGFKGDSAQVKRFISGAEAVLLAGLVLIGLFVAWGYWNYR